MHINVSYTSYSLSGKKKTLFTSSRTYAHTNVPYASYSLGDEINYFDTVFVLRMESFHIEVFPFKVKICVRKTSVSVLYFQIVWQMCNICAGFDTKFLTQVKSTLCSNSTNFRIKKKFRYKYLRFT